MYIRLLLYYKIPYLDHTIIPKLLIDFWIICCYICRIYRIKGSIMSHSKTDSAVQSQDRKQKYEDKRVFRPVSFNNITDERLLKILDKKAFCYSKWVKNVLGELTNVEISLLKDDINIVPASLIEYCIEKQYFDLDEYLRSKGLKAVSITEGKSSHGFAHQQQPYYAVDDFNQELYP